MRGKADTSKSVFCSNRITPAYAGKSSILLAGIQMVWDHPRLCGEKCRRLRLCQRHQGSPPPMRGKAQKQACESFNDRITPAYAGKSRLLRCSRSDHRDHPRLCGEKLVALHLTSWEQGSPPPMRGKACASSITKSSWRITPAYAGKSGTAAMKGNDMPDHPRLCGEKLRGACIFCAAGGSPPPMRGKGICFFTNSKRIRITPAYAGKSSPP